ARRRPPAPTAFPYTTLFRSRLLRGSPRPYRVKRGRARREGAPIPDCCVVATRRAERALWGTTARQLVSPLTVRTPLSKKGSARSDRKSTRLNSSHVKISYAV